MVFNAVIWKHVLRMQNQLNGGEWMCLETNNMKINLNGLNLAWKGNTPCYLFSRYMLLILLWIIYTPLFKCH